MIIKQQEITVGVITIVVGILVSYFAFKMILPSFEGVSFYNLSSEASSTLVDPDVNVFNYRAINPTVEVNVGSSNTTATNEPEPEPEPEPESEPESEPEFE